MEEENILITIIDRADNVQSYDAPTNIGLNLMEFMKAIELPVLATCGGMALCATCQVYIESDHNLPDPSYDEELMLDQAVNYKSNSRLACQIKLDQELNGLVVRLAPEDN